MNIKHLKLVFATLGALFCLPAMASIPVTPPSQGGETDLIRAFASYGSDIGQLAGYGLAVIGIISCGFIVSSAFKQGREQGNYSGFLTTATFGILLVVGLLYLVNIAIGILVDI